jgi:hypothetical protein
VATFVLSARATGAPGVVSMPALTQNSPARLALNAA